MNRSFFSKIKYMIVVGFKKLVCITPPEILRSLRVKVVLKMAAPFVREITNMLMLTAVETRPWTNRFRSVITTIVNSSSQSHMVDPDWIQILRKAAPTCVKGNVTVSLTWQCSENSYWLRVV